MRIALIGGGVMAEAIIAGVLKNGVAGASDINVADIAEARRTHLSTTYGVSTCEGAREAAAGAEMVVIAVKPQQFGDVAEQLRKKLDTNQLVVSIAAGLSIATLSSRLQHAKIVRAMPNTPAQIGEGISIWTATVQVDEDQKTLARRLLEALGPAIEVDDEKQLDMATAVSGSGPAYVFLFIESLIDAAVAIGLSRDLAGRLVLQTISGSASFAQQSDRHAAELRNMVTSPGGTTAAALDLLEERGFRAAIAGGVAAAYHRAQTLSQAS